MKTNIRIACADSDSGPWEMPLADFVEASQIRLEDQLRLEQLELGETITLPGGLGVEHTYTRTA